MYITCTVCVLSEYMVWLCYKIVKLVYMYIHVYLYIHQCACAIYVHVTCIFFAEHLLCDHLLTCTHLRGFNVWYSCTCTSLCDKFTDVHVHCMYTYTKIQGLCCFWEFNVCESHLTVVTLDQCKGTILWGWYMNPCGTCTCKLAWWLAPGWSMAQPTLLWNLICLRYAKNPTECVNTSFSLISLTLSG